MSTTFHPREQLSAYFDGALAPAERASVEAHLGGCAECRAHLAELRGVSALLRSLPAPLPSRRLTPRIASAPMWLAPLRTLTTLASGVSVFLFLASAVLANIGWLAQGAATDSTTSGAAALPPAAAHASAASASSPAQDRNKAQTASQAVVSPSPGAFAAATAPAPTAVPASVGLGAGPAASAATAQSQSLASTRIQVGPSPWFWLGVAIVTGVAALALQRRLRSP